MPNAAASPDAAGPDAASPDDASLPLRDRLALDRTRLANERTLLAYVRTALALLAGGLTLLHFVDTAWAAVVGGAALPLSGVVLAVGAARFGRVRRRLRGELTDRPADGSGRRA